MFSPVANDRHLANIQSYLQVPVFINFVNKGTQAENWRLKKLVSPEGELSGTEER